MAHSADLRFKNLYLFSLATNAIHFSPIPMACRGLCWLCCVVLQFWCTMQGVFAWNIYDSKQINIPPLHSASVCRFRPGVPLILIINNSVTRGTTETCFPITYWLNIKWQGNLWGSVRINLTVGSLCEQRLYPLLLCLLFQRDFSLPNSTELDFQTWKLSGVTDTHLSTKKQTCPISLENQYQIRNGSAEISGIKPVNLLWTQWQSWSLLMRH